MPLPGRGPSSPIVVGGDVIVTASSGVRQDRLHVLCFDTGTGKTKWERQFWATGRTLTHPTSANAAPTPASDGESIYAFFSSNDLACLNLTGDLRWYRGLGYDFPKAGNDIGMASSPVVASDTVVCQVESQGDSFVIGIDTTTGKSRWRLPRERQSNWSSPTVLRGDRDVPDLVLLKSGEAVSGHDLTTGEAVWRYETEAGGIPSIVVASGHAYVPGDRLTVLDVASQSQALLSWDSNRIRPSGASPIVHGDHIYSLNSSGVLTCSSTRDGEKQWQLRLKGNFWATPVLADGHLYAVNDEGTLQIVRVGDQAEQLGSFDFGEPILGSPAAADGAMYVRSDSHLWKIAATD